MKKKLVILCLTAALSVSMLNGCGGKNDTKEQGGTSETTEVSDQEAADKVAKLIDDIYVQERTDKTDEQCAEDQRNQDALPIVPLQTGLCPILQFFSSPHNRYLNFLKAVS